MPRIVMPRNELRGHLLRRVLTKALTQNTDTEYRRRTLLVDPVA